MTSRLSSGTLWRLILFYCAFKHAPLLHIPLCWATVYYRITQFYLAKALARTLSISWDLLFTKMWVENTGLQKNMLLFVLWLWAYQLLFYFLQAIACVYYLGDSTVLPNWCYIYFHKVLKICSCTSILAFMAMIVVLYFGFVLFYVKIFFKLN